jgi:peptide/nickel transport system permease protein
VNARFILGRIATGAVTVLLATFLSFVLLRVFPGDPARAVLGSLASPESIATLREDMGLDRSIPEQFWIYIRDFFSGDWGFSYSTGLPVITLMGQRIMATVELALTAFVLAFVPAVILALLVTYRPRRWLDVAARGLAYIAIGTPTFWLALLALILGYEHWHVLPGPEGRLSADESVPPTITGLYTFDAFFTGRFDVFGDALWHVLLPALVLAFPSFGFIFLLLRVNLLEVRNEPFLLVVRSKGISRWWAFVRHALPNAFLPTLTASGLVLAGLLTGTVLVEAVFAWPGAGALVVDSVQRQDFAVVQAFILLAAIVYVVVNTLVDILYGIIDPRVRLKAAGATA